MPLVNKIRHRPFKNNPMAFNTKYFSNFITLGYTT